MVACFGKMSPLRQEVLLYMSISILITNTMNALYNEWNFYNVDVLQLIKNNSYQTLIKYGEFLSLRSYFIRTTVKSTCYCYSAIGKRSIPSFFNEYSFLMKNCIVFSILWDTFFGRCHHNNIIFR